MKCEECESKSGTRWQRGWPRLLPRATSAAVVLQGTGVADASAAPHMWVDACANIRSSSQSKLRQWIQSGRLASDRLDASTQR